MSFGWFVKIILLNEELKTEAYPLFLVLLLFIVFLNLKMGQYNSLMTWNFLPWGFRTYQEREQSFPLQTHTHTQQQQLQKKRYLALCKVWFLLSEGYL